MSSTYRSAIGAALLMVTVGLAMPAAQAAEEAPLAIQFNETLRVKDQHTFVEKGNGSLSEHVTSEAGAVRIEATMPLDRDLTLDPDTPLVLSAGNLTLRSSLSADPHYHAGMHQANILLTTPSRSGKSALVYGHLKLKWSRTQLTVQVDGNIPQLSPVCAREVLGNPMKVTSTRVQQPTSIDLARMQPGGTTLVSFAEANEGETRAILEIGRIRATARVHFHARSSARSTNGGSYEDSGIDWKYIKASPGEMDGGEHRTRETTIKVTGSSGS